jgi:hypothetical protein
MIGHTRFYIVFVVLCSFGPGVAVRDAHPNAREEFHSLLRMDDSARKAGDNQGRLIAMTIVQKTSFLQAC